MYRLYEFQKIVMQEGFEISTTRLLMDMSDSRLESEGVRRRSALSGDGEARCCCCGDGGDAAAFASSSGAASSSSVITFRSSVTLGWDESKEGGGMRRLPCTFT